MNALPATRNVARWVFYEFLAFSFRRDLVSMLTNLCRLTGCLITAMLLYAQLYGQLSESVFEVAPRLLIAIAISVAVGVLAKELAFLSATSLANARGRDFTRHGPMLNGRVFRETHYSDGRWIRYEIGPKGTVYAWTDSDGNYHRTNTPPPPTLGY